MFYLIRVIFRVFQFVLTFKYLFFSHAILVINLANSKPNWYWNDSLIIIILLLIIKSTQIIQTVCVSFLIIFCVWNQSLNFFFHMIMGSPIASFFCDSVFFHLLLLKSNTSYLFINVSLSSLTVSFSVAIFFLIFHLLLITSHFKG